MDDSASHATEPPDHLSSSELTDDAELEPAPRSNPFRRRLADLAEPDISVHQPVCSVLFSSLEQALAMAGGFGRFHVMFIIMLQLLTTEFAGNYMLMTLSVHKPDVSCTFYGNNGTNETITLDTPNRDAFCTIYETGNCTRLVWTSQFQGTAFKTIIEEWNLICNLDHVPDMINSATLFGPLATAFVISALSDFYGRKRVYIASTTVMLAANLVCSTVTHWQTYLAARIMCMSANYASIGTVFLWSLEFTPSTHHTIVNLAGMWHVAYVASGSLAYITNGWRQYLIGLDILMVAIISWSFGLPESPSWLIQSGKLDQASDSLNAIAKFNRGKQAPRFNALHLNSINQQRANGRNRLGSFDSAEYNPGQSKFKAALKNIAAVIQFLCHKRPAYYLWLLCCMVISVSSCANGYIFQMSKTQLDPHLMIIIYGAVRLIVMPPVIWLDHKLMTFGRREMACISLLLATLCLSSALTCRIIWPENVDADRTDVWRDWALMLAAAISANFIYVVMGQYIVELFPTVQRNRISAITACVDSLVAIVMPQVVYLEQYWPNIMLIFCTTATGIAFLMALTLLPETKGKPMPDNFSEEELLLQFAHDDLVQCKLCFSRSENNSQLLHNMEQNENTVET